MACRCRQSAEDLGATRKWPPRRPPRMRTHGPFIDACFVHNQTPPTHAHARVRGVCTLHHISGLQETRLRTHACVVYIVQSSPPCEGSTEFDILVSSRRMLGDPDTCQCLGHENSLRLPAVAREREAFRCRSRGRKRTPCLRRVAGKIMQKCTLRRKPFHSHGIRPECAEFSTWCCGDG
jgi:hypothetical protein